MADRPAKLKLPIYLDNQATTPLDPEVLKAMMPYMEEKYGNPHSTQHRFGWEGEAAVEVARQGIATVVGADGKEIIFTSGATEANNLAIKGIFETFKDKKREIITVRTEHKCVLKSCRAIERAGANIIYLEVGADGLISLEHLQNAISRKTALVSVMAVNNEIGVIQPLTEIGRMCGEKKVLFHSDAAQALGKIPLDVAAMNISLMSISAHKIYGPKGIGALYVRKAVQRLVKAQMSGGGQEAGIRSGTLSPALCAGFGKAAEIIAEEMDSELTRMAALSKRFLRVIRETCPEAVVNGSLEQRWPGNVNIRFPGVDGDKLIAALGDIAISSGAACTSALEEPSYVLEAIGVSERDAKSSVRISFGRFNTVGQAVYAARYLAEVVQTLIESRP